MNRHDAKLFLIRNGYKPMWAKKRILSFSYPPSFEKIFKKLRKIYNQEDLGDILEIYLEYIELKDYRKSLIETASIYDIDIKTYEHNKYKFNSLYVKSDVFQKLKLLAALNDVTVSSIIRFAFADTYKRIKKKH